MDLEHVECIYLFIHELKSVLTSNTTCQSLRETSVVFCKTRHKDFLVGLSNTIYVIMFSAKAMFYPNDEFNRNREHHLCNNKHQWMEASSRDS